MPTFDDVRLALELAVESLNSQDSQLLRSNASEWAIAHRLAVYLEQRLPSWDVDCEFNRQGTAGAGKLRNSGARVRPDVIVHHRGELSADHNLLVVEVKKYASDEDLQKLIEYTSEPIEHSKRKFQYRFGAAVVLEPLSITWFQNGNRIG